MKIDKPEDVSAVNERFNHFHDGFIKRIELELASEVMELKSPDGELFEDEVWTGTTVEVEILHYNYDYPNQPENRVVILRSHGCTEIHEKLTEFLGSNVFDLSFCRENGQIQCMLVYHEEGVGMIRSLENGTEICLFVTESVEAEESLHTSGENT